MGREARTVIVGDVHGCTGELEELLDRIHFSSPGDRLVFVGDLIARGPDSRGALALAKRLGASMVRGNHEEKLIAWKRRGKAVGPEHERLGQALSDEEWLILEEMPLWIDLPEHGIRVVHAGVVPGVDFDCVPREALLKIRTVDPKGRWSDAPDAGPLWGELYAGPPHVVFGHNARAAPQTHAWATGLDTGCVYGGRLTAVVLEGGEPLPHGEDVRTKLESVPAMRRYYGDKGAPL
jgi:hypothetical protein